jgi:hypothetical protein
MGSVLANSESCELFEKSRGAKRAGCGANSPDRSLFRLCSPPNVIAEEIGEFRRKSAPGRSRNRWRRATRVAALPEDGGAGHAPGRSRTFITARGGPTPAHRPRVASLARRAAGAGPAMVGASRPCGTLMIGTNRAWEARPGGLEPPTPGLEEQWLRPNQLPFQRLAALPTRL